MSPVFAEILVRRALEPEARWFVLHTKSRQEKALSSSLASMGVSHYLPLVRRICFYGPRKVRVDVPLFPSYVFLWGTLDNAYMADRTKRIAGVVRVVDQEKLEWELKNIRLALEKRAPLLPCAYLTEGMRVEVRGGPFRGLQGLVKRRGRPDRLVLQVDAFGGGAYLEIDADLLDPMN